MRRGALLLAALCACSAPRRAPAVLSGLDVLREEGFKRLRGKRVGLITNRTGVDRAGRGGPGLLARAPGVELAALFSPEHGLGADSEENVIASGRYRLPDGRDIPLYSLYGGTKSPTGEMLRGLDALLFDVQDVGARFYTYATTMALAQEAAAARGVAFIILDRPNPIGGTAVEGPVLEDGIRHFTAYLPVAVRHGMTPGELGLLHAARAGLPPPSVVPARGWRRGLWHDRTGLPWVRPSPNMPDLEAAALYPGIGCFEAANVSVGRGTEAPFRLVGAPWMDAGRVVERLSAAGLKGLRARAVRFTPAKPPYSGVEIAGVRLEVTDRDALRPLDAFAHLVAALRDLHPGDFRVRDEELSRMTGTRRFLELYHGGASARELVALFDDGARRFREERAGFLLYR